MTNKFTALLGNDAMINVYFYEHDSEITTDGNIPYSISNVQNLSVELINKFHKRQKLTFKLQEPNVLSIELPVDVQKIGNYFLEIRFEVPNSDLADGMQAYRLRLDGVSIIEAGAVSGQVGATFSAVDPNVPSRSTLLSTIETLTTERDQANEQKIAAEEARNLALTQKEEADAAKVRAEEERDQAIDQKNSLDTQVRSFTSVLNNESDELSVEFLTTVTPSLFARRTALTNVNLPHCTEIKESAFLDCQSLTSVTAPNVRIVAHNAFSNAPIERINMPEIESIGSAAFVRNNLVSIRFDECEVVGARAFQSSTQLSSVSLSKVNKLLSQTFHSCAALKTVNIPNLQVIDSFVFADCTSIEEIDINNVTEIGGYAFSGCVRLRDITATKCASVSANAFQNVHP